MDSAPTYVAAIFLYFFYFLFLFEKFFLFKPPWSKHVPGCSHSSAWFSPKNPAAHPASGLGFSHPGPCAGPGDLIVLKHSSYCQIFQCSLTLVSNLHICWNTVGCSLCSSDQIGVSLVLRGSGLCSHLSHLLALFLYPKLVTLVRENNTF